MVPCSSCATDGRWLQSASCICLNVIWSSFSLSHLKACCWPHCLPGMRSDESGFFPRAQVVFISDNYPSVWARGAARSRPLSRRTLAQRVLHYGWRRTIRHIIPSLDNREATARPWNAHFTFYSHVALTQIELHWQLSWTLLVCVSFYKMKPSSVLCTGINFEEWELAYTHSVGLKPTQDN